MKLMFITSDLFIQSRIESESFRLEKTAKVT